MKRAFELINQAERSKQRAKLTTERDELNKSLDTIKEKLSVIETQLQEVEGSESSLVETLTSKWWAAMPESQVPEELKNQEWLVQRKCTLEHEVRVTFTGYKYNDIDEIDYEEIENEIDDRLLKGIEEIRDEDICLHGDWKTAIIDAVIASKPVADNGFDVWDGDTPYCTAAFSVPTVLMRLDSSQCPVSEEEE